MGNDQARNEIVQNCAVAVSKAYSKMIGKKVFLKGARFSSASFESFLSKLAASSPSLLTLVYFIIYRLSTNKNQPGETKTPVGFSVVTFEAQNKKPLTEAQRSFAAETGNVLIGAFLSGLSNSLNDNLCASIQPVFKASATEASRILDNQLFHGDKKKEMTMIEVLLEEKEQASLYVFLKNKGA